MSKLKIILITNLSKSKGGAFIAALRISNILKKIFNVKIIPPDIYSPVGKLKYLLALLLKKVFIGRSSYLNSLNLFSRISLNKIKFDILHLNWTGEETIALDQIFRINKPIIWTMHDMWLPSSTEHFFDDPSIKRYTKKNLNNNFLKKIIFNKKKKIFQKKNIHLVANSNWLKNFAMKSELTKKNKISLIYNPIKCEVWQRQNEYKSKKILKLDTSKKYILYGAYGGLKNYRKGGDLLLDSLKEINNMDKDIEIIVLGGNSNFTKKEFNIKFNFRKLETDQKIQNMYHSSSILTVCPYRAESLPQFVIETLLCKNPVVAFDIGGMKEIITHKSNGFLAKAYDTKNFAKGIEYCLSKITQKKLSKSRNKIKKMFDEKKILKKYKNIIEELVTK